MQLKIQNSIVTRFDATWRRTAKILFLIFGLIFFFGCAGKGELKPMVGADMRLGIETNHSEPSQIPKREVQAGIEADVGALFKTLAEIARLGSSAICDTKYLGEKLQLNFEIPETYKIGVWDTISTLVNSASNKTDISFGRHRIFFDSKERKCSLLIDFKSRKICSLTVLEARKIFGVKEKYGVPVPGRTMRPIFYEFLPATGTKSTISVGMTTDCNNGFSITSEEIFK